MLLRIMYVLPMILGRTYDMRKNLVGVDIFPLESIQTPLVTKEPFYNTNFKVIETSTDVKDVLEIKGDLSLGIKAGLFTFRGTGSYVKETLNSLNSVDILTKVSFRTVSKQIPVSAKPVPTWFDMGKDYLGTHFVRSILYGGELIACVRFKAVKSEYLQDIRAAIKTSVEAGSALDLVGEGKLENLDKKLEKKATMEINYYGTVPLEGVPNTIKGLRELVRNFESHVKKQNDGLGVPVEIELEDLSTLNQKVSYIKNMDLDSELGFFENYLDDLLKTKSKMNAWILNLPDTLSKEQEKQISDFSERLSSVLRKFIDTIANLNLEGGTAQLDDAKAAYKEGKGPGMPGKFNRDLNKLLRQVVPSKEIQDRGSTVYTQYGASECAKDEYTSTVLSGYLASSPRKSIGAGYNYLCFPKPTSRTTQESLEGGTSTIAGVKYGLMQTKPSRIDEDKTVFRSVACAVCLVKQRTNIHTFLGRSECPTESDWILQYKGYIMSTTDTSRSENICVDSGYGSNLDTESSYYDQNLNFVLAEQDKRNVFIPCAVCSK